MNGDEFELNATNVRRCKGKDHNVLYTLLVTSVHAKCDAQEQLQMVEKRLQEALQETEIAVALLSNLKKDKEDLYSKMAAVHQQLCDKAGKAKAETYILSRDMRDLQNKLQNSESLIASAEAAASISRAEADAKVAQLHTEAMQALNDLQTAEQQRADAKSESEAAHQAQGAAEAAQDAAEASRSVAEAAATAAQAACAQAVTARQQADELQQAADRRAAAAELATASAVMQAQAAESDRQQMQNSLQAATDELATLRSKLQTVTQEMDAALDNSQRQQLESTAAKSELSATVNSLEDQLAQEETAHQNTQDALERLQTDKSDLQSQLDKLDVEKKTLVEQLQKINNDLQEEKETAQTAREQAEKEASDAKQAADALLQSTKSHAADEMKKAQKAADELMAQAGQAAEARLLEAHGARDKLQQTLDTEKTQHQLTADQLQSTEGAKVQAEQQQMQLKDELAELKATEGRLREKLAKREAKTLERKQALAAAEQRAAEYEGLLEDAQLKFESVAKHRKSAQKQLDAQEEDLEHLGHRLKAASPAVVFPSPGSTLASPSPRRTSRRDADLGLPTTAPAESPSPRHEPYQAMGGTAGPSAAAPSAAVPAQAASPASAASQPYYASPDEEGDRMMSEDDDDEEISLAGTPEGEQEQAAEEAPKTWGQRLLGNFIFRSSSKAPKESSAGRSPGTPVTNMASTLAGLQPAAAAAPSPALGSFSQGTTQGQAPAALRQSGRKRKSVAAAKPAETLPVTDAMQEGVGGPQVHQGGPSHASDASTDSKKRKVDELQQVFVEYREAVHSPPKRHRLATTTHASVDAAVKAAGDAAAQAVIDAAAAAPTAAEAAAAAEEANVAVAEAAHEVVAHAAPAAQVASGGNAPGHEDGEASEGAKGKPAGKTSGGHLAKQAKQASQQPPSSPSHAPTEPATDATANLAAAAAVALPDSSTPAPPTTRKRGRPSNLERAAKQKAAGEPAGTQQQPSAAATATTATTAAEKPSAAEPSTDAASSGDAASGQDSDKARKGSKIGPKGSGARANGGKARKQEAPTRVKQPAAAATLAQEAPGEEAKKGARKRTSSSTTSGTAAKKPRTSTKADSGAKSVSVRRTSGRTASKGTGGGGGAGPGAPPALSTRSRKSSVSADLSKMEDTAGTPGQDIKMPAIPEEDEEEADE